MGFNLSIALSFWIKLAFFFLKLVSFCVSSFVSPCSVYNFKPFRFLFGLMRHFDPFYILIH